MGRLAELGTLQRWLHQSGTDRGGLALVSGAAGIGKSFLLRRFAEHAQEEGWAIGWGHVETGSRSQLPWPWPTILRGLPGEACPRLARELAALALDDVGRGSEPETVFSGSRLNGSKLALQLTEAIEATAETQPTLVVVDDAQRLDPLAVATLRMVAEIGDELPLLIVAAARPEDPESTPGDSALTEFAFQAGERILELKPLFAEEISSILGEELTTRLGGKRAAARLTSGNPLFARELFESSRVSSETAPGADDLAGVMNSLAVRCLQALGPEDREIVETAALLDEALDAGFLARVLERELAEVERALESDAVSSFLVTDPSTTSSALRFAHELLAEAIEASLDPALRRERHTRLACELERRAAQGAPLDPAVLAHHAYRGAPSFPCDRAAQWALRAAREANASGARNRAALWARRGLENLERDDAPENVSTRIDLLLEEFAANHLSEPQQALTSLRTAVQLAQTGSPKELARIASSALEIDGEGIHTSREVTAALSDLLERALVANADSPGLLVDLLARKAFARHFLSGSHSLDESVASGRAALEASSDLDPSHKARGFAMIASLWCDPWRHALDERIAMAEEFEEIARGHPGQLLRILNQVVLLMDHFASGDLPQANNDAKRLSDIVALQAGHPMSWLPFHQRAAFAAMACDAAAVHQSLEAGLEARGPGPDPFAQGAALVLQYHMIEVLGPQANFGWQPETDPKAWELIGQSRANTLANSPAAEAAIRAGFLKGIAPHAPDVVREALDEMVRTDFIEFPQYRSWLASNCLLAEASSLVEHKPAAERLLEMLRPFTDRFAVTELALTFAGHVSGFAAPLANLVGNFEEADALGERAIAENDRMGLVFYAARCRLERARMLLEHGGRSRDREAHELADQAAATVDRYAMAGLAAWLEALPQTTRAQTPPAPPPSQRDAQTPEFWRDGDVWTMGWEGRRVTLKAQRGFEFLHTLLQKPGKSLHVRELMAQGAAPSAPMSAGQRRELQTDEDAGLEVLDETALRSYRSRLKELEQGLEEAQSRADRGRVETLQAEREALLEALRGATGLGGRMRKTGSSAERARTAVRKRIKAALDRIREELPALHVHLSASLRTGVLCAYEPLEAPTWKTEP